LAILAVVPKGVLLRFGVGGRLGNRFRVIRRWIGIGIVIGGRIITVGIVVGEPKVSADVAAGTSIEMASTIIPSVSTVVSSVSTIISTMPT
jgi:hypothetical protein